MSMMKSMAIGALCAVVFITGVGTGSRTTKHFLCINEGYDGSQQIGTETYCYIGSGDDIEFVRLAPPMIGD